ncbi:hypothetical protein J1N09_05465 [Aureitalea sp. L0-47]|uniref:M56 family metallopeptidase n=1 Tax=Aureitalea sp. L0-47 TaxID=2816962 RepID=UPI002238E55C|nr:M56 family metallopeptidase [Aureitalea sp. L0-47]MCW5519277.1 hypothetical protein [Aureitalea sp. L0-47]
MEPATYLLKSAAILAMFYLIYILFLRKETHFKAHRIFLITGIVASFLLPFLYFTQTIYIDVPAVSNLIIPTPTGNSVEVITEPIIEPVNWWNVGLYAYLTGLGLMLLRFVVQLLSLWMIIYRNPVRKLDGFRYVRVSRKIAPFSFFNYIVYNPELHTEDELQMILKHEQAHAFQWHSADILLSNLLLILQWANPFAWLYKKSVEENLEFLADNATIIAVPDKKDYQLALVKASSAEYIPALTTNFYKSFIKKRIIMLNKRTSKKYHVLKVATVLPLLAIFLWSFNVKQDIAYNVIPSEVEPETPVTETSVAEITTSETPEDHPTEALVMVTTESAASGATLEKSRESEPVVAKVNSAASLAMVLQDLELKITKNTTDAQLNEIKTKVKKEHGIDLSYSVERNSNDEITGIQLSYSGNGNNGNYSIQDDEGISDFVFYIDEDGRSGFYSEEVEARRAERAYARAARLSERANERRREMREGRKQQERTREEIIVEREAMRKEIDKRRKEMDEQRKEMRDQMREKRRAIRIESDGDDGGLFDDDEDVIKEYVIAGYDGNQGESDILVIDSNSGKLALFGEGSEHAIMIDKDTTNDHLSKIKKKMKAQGVDFKYSKVKRNSNGEITGIKITLDNKKGSRKTVVTKADDGEPIEEMLIELQ